MIFKRIALAFLLLCPFANADLLSSSKPSDWRSVDPANVLYMQLPSGRVIIELNPDFAPESVPNVKALAKEKYWDGLAVVRVQDNYVVQWADPNSDKPELKKKLKAAHEHVNAELDVPLNAKAPFDHLKDPDGYAKEVGFSNGFAVGRDLKTKRMWPLHCYGAVGVGRDTPADSGNGTELYAVIGNAPRQLDRNVTLIGRVLQGMEFFSSLPRGHGVLGFYEKPEQNVTIRSIDLAANVAEKDRIDLEVLRTDTSFFKEWLESKRNRKEDWFHYQVNHIDVCNVPIPVRVKK
jgi:peptidylprolyl isomerase